MIFEVTLGESWKTEFFGNPKNKRANDPLGTTVERMTREEAIFVSNEANAERGITTEQNNHAKHVRATKHYRTSLLLLIGRPKFMPHYIPHRSNILPRKLDDNEN